MGFVSRLSAGYSLPKHLLEVAAVRSYGSHFHSPGDHMLKQWCVALAHPFRRSRLGR